MKDKTLNVERLAYSVQESAAMIGISSRMLHEYIKDGSLPHFRLGTRVLVPESELKDFITSRIQAAAVLPSPQQEDKQ